jgi:DNA-directed RNA polymerase specialized sigma24 family protein
MQKINRDGSKIAMWQEVFNLSHAGAIQAGDAAYAEIISIVMPEAADAGCQRLITQSGAAASAMCRKKTWDLTADAFDQLLRYLHPDQASAGRCYENIRQKLIKYFECRQCLWPEDLADQTIDRVARKIIEGTELWASNPVSYFYGVARNVLREYWNAPERGAVSTDDIPESIHPCVDLRKLKEIEAQEQLNVLQVTVLKQCLENIKSESRDLIIEYYQGEKGSRKRRRKMLADQLGIPANALRIRIHRIKGRLAQMVEECLRLLQESEGPPVNPPVRH